MSHYVYLWEPIFCLIHYVQPTENSYTYRQMIIDELRLHESANQVVIEEEHATHAQNKRKDSFYEFDTLNFYKLAISCQNVVSSQNLIPCFLTFCSTIEFNPTYL